MSRFEFELQGLTPLLMHHDNIALADQLTEWRKDSRNKNISKAGDDRSPPWAWHTYLYHDGEHLAIPSINLWTVFRDAATSKSLKGQKSFKEAAAAGIYIEQEYLPLMNNGKKIPIGPIEAMREKSFNEQMAAVKKLGFELLSKRAQVGTSKHLRVRPKFNNWSLSGTLLVNVPEINGTVLRDIGDIAGRYKGLGDGRPGSRKPWPYGVFSVTFKEI